MTLPAAVTAIIATASTATPTQRTRLGEAWKARLEGGTVADREEFHLACVVVRRTALEAGYIGDTDGAVALDRATRSLRAAWHGPHARSALQWIVTAAALVNLTERHGIARGYIDTVLEPWREVFTAADVIAAQLPTAGGTS